MALKVLTLVGTRPEIIKLSRIVQACEKYFNHILVHTGQNYDYELNEIFFEDLGVPKPSYFLNAAGKNVAETISSVIAKFDEVLELTKPDAILIYGDTNSALGVIAAKRRQIPIFHMEAGNRCFDQRVPEELNRKVVDHLSDINMVHSEHARRYLIAEGLKPETIIKSGSPMPEVLSFYQKQIHDSNVLKTLDLQAKNFFLVSTHREENVDYPNNFVTLFQSLNAVAEEYKMPIIVSTHPRTRKKLDSTPEIKMNPLVHFMKPLGFYDYNKLQQNALCVISDSGTITEEASILKFPAIMIRQAHERPEGMDAGIVIMSGLSSENILSSIKIATDESIAKVIPDIDDYRDHQVSQQVVKIIQSYTEYINRTVWRKI